MRINTLKCEMEPAVCCPASGTVHRIGGNTQSTTNSHPLRDTYVCVCVFAIAPTCHCAARHKYWRQRRRSVEVVLMARCIRQSFQLKFKLMQTSGQAPFHGESLRLNCSCTTRPSPSRGARERQLLLSDPGPALTN